MPLHRNHTSNIPLITLLIENLNGNPEAFEALSEPDRKLVTDITGEYPKGWNQDKGEFTGEKIRGPKDNLQTSEKWAETFKKSVGVGPNAPAAKPPGFTQRAAARRHAKG